MNAEKFVAAIEKFFLDVIGTIIPGLALLAGVWAFVGPVRLGNLTVAVPTTEDAWTLTVVLAYILGHALTSLGEGLLVPLVAPLGKVPLINRFTEHFDTDDGRALQAGETPEASEVARKVYGSPDVLTPPDAKKVRSLRGTAMTIASDHTPTINRFTFISLLNLGIATALWVTAVAVLTRAIRAAFPQSWNAGWATIGDALLIVLPLVLVSLVFLERRFHFFRHAMNAPFQMAVAVLAMEEKKEKESTPAPVPRAAPAVYLAGGLASNWQDTVITGVAGARYLDPRKHGLADARAATAWRLAALAASDMVFANLEKTEPGYALAMEMGYAKGLGKHVILVDEKTAADPVLAPSLEPLSELAHAPFPTLAQGMTYLQERLKLM